MKLESKLYVAGHCLNFSAATFKRDPWRVQEYPAICVHIRHPDFGHILFDTGYSDAFFAATSSFPSKFYRMATPVRLSQGESLAEQLRADGVSPGDIHYVILSHFHADHLGGVKDFPNARFIARAEGWAYVRNDVGIKALRKGFLPSLMPSDFSQRLFGISQCPNVDLAEEMRPFSAGFDIFGDGSLVAVLLEGHARSQIGLLFDDKQHGPTFLCADAAWSRKAIRTNTGPGLLGYLAVDSKRQTDATLSRLHELYSKNRNLRFVPSHCPEVWAEIKAGNRA